MSSAGKGTGQHVMKPFNSIDVRTKEIFLDVNLEQLRHV